MQQGFWLAVSSRARCLGPVNNCARFVAAPGPVRISASRHLSFCAWTVSMLAKLISDFSNMICMFWSSSSEPAVRKARISAHRSQNFVFAPSGPIPLVLRCFHEKAGICLRTKLTKLSRAWS